MQSGKLEYYPNERNYMQSLEKSPNSYLAVDKLKRNDDKTFAITGSFKAIVLPAGVLAKELKGKTLAVVSGQFDFAEVNICNMFK